MKCLEEYTIEQIKEMSHEELKVLWEEFVKEKQKNEMRIVFVKELEIMEASKPLIES